MLKAIVALLLAMTSYVRAVEIPLESVSASRIGYVDLQKVFDTYPEKAFAEGDLLKEIQKRRTEMAGRQNLINVMRRQIAADQAALDQAKAGKPTMVPPDEVTPLLPVQAAPLPPPPAPAETKKSTAPAAVEPYPTEEPLAGLPGHEGGAPPPSTTETKLPGMQQEPIKPTTSPLLESLAASGTSSALNAEAQAALQKRLSSNKLALDRVVYQFKDYRGKALEDMKQLQTEKTYGVMSRIYAVLQGLARDEGIMAVMDKAYVLYGEETIDLTDKLIARLNQEQG